MYAQKLLRAIQKLAVELGDLIAAAGRRVTIHRDDQDLVAVEACIEVSRLKKLCSSKPAAARSIMDKATCDTTKTLPNRDCAEDRYDAVP